MEIQESVRQTVSRAVTFSRFLRVLVLPALLPVALSAVWHMGDISSHTWMARAAAVLVPGCALAAFVFFSGKKRGSLPERIPEDLLFRLLFCAVFAAAAALRLAETLAPGAVVVTVLCDCGFRYLSDHFWNPPETEGVFDWRI